MTVDALVVAAREQRLVSSGVDGVKSWLEAHEAVQAAVEKVARPFAEPLGTLVGAADKAIGYSVSAVETNVYKPVVEKNGGTFTLSGAVEVANHNMTDLAKSTYNSVQKKVTCALNSSMNYVIPDDQSNSSEGSDAKEPTMKSTACELRCRVKKRAVSLAANVRDFSRTRLPVDVVAIADRTACRTQFLYKATCSNASTAASATKKAAIEALNHATNVGFFSVPKEIGSIGLQSVGLLTPGPEYALVRNSVQNLFVAYKRLLLFEEPEKASSN